MGKKEQKFKTKTGYCHILPDKIVFTRTGVIGNLAEIKVKENSTRILIMYGIIATGLLFSGYTNYLTGHNLTALIFGGFGLFLLNGIIRSLNFSGTPLIYRADIQSVVFKKGVWGMSRDRFEVVFTNEKGNHKKRLILLPGVLTTDEKTTSEAMKIMVESRLMPETTYKISED